VSNFVFKELVAFVLLCIATDLACVLVLEDRELMRVCFVLFRGAVGALFARGAVNRDILRFKNAWSKVLSVENSYFFLIDDDEQKTFRQEEALIYRATIANVKAIELKLGVNLSVLCVVPVC
jgi:hypothetical protein